MHNAAPPPACRTPGPNPAVNMMHWAPNFIPIERFWLILSDAFCRAIITHQFTVRVEDEIRSFGVSTKELVWFYTEAKILNA